MHSMEDMKEMIRREVQSISTLDERVAFKELMEGVFLALYEKNEEMYQKLEERVLDDLAYNINRYRICTGLIEKSYWDESHHLMRAMCEEDTKPMKYKVSDIRETVAEKGKFCLTTIFLQSDVLEVKQMLRENTTWEGLLKSKEEYPVSVRLEPSIRYLDKIEQLYHIFIKNGVPWKTVNAPYLFKMLDVVVTELPEELEDEEYVTGFAADFKEYDRIVHYDMLPIWNVWHLKMESVGFPIACGDHENYEHIISIQEHGTDHAYLVEDKSGIRNVRQQGDRLLVTGTVANAKKWDIYTIRSGGENRIDRYQYPLMENMRKDGFAERLQHKTQQPIKTKGELERFIRGFGMEPFIEYQDCLLEEEHGEIEETYSMNFFMKDEIRNSKGRQYLTLNFKGKGEETWLYRDIASFIVSEVQALYPEYHCRGRIL